MADTEADTFYWSEYGACLGLSNALREIEELEEVEPTRAYGLALHEEQQRDRAVARAKAAIRYLTTD